MSWNNNELLKVFTVKFTFTTFFLSLLHPIKYNPQSGVFEVPETFFVILKKSVYTQSYPVLQLSFRWLKNFELTITHIMFVDISVRVWIFVSAPFFLTNFSKFWKKPSYWSFFYSFVVFELCQPQKPESLSLLHPIKYNPQSGVFEVPETFFVILKKSVYTQSYPVLQLSFRWLKNFELTITHIMFVDISVRVWIFVSAPFFLTNFSKFWKKPSYWSFFYSFVVFELCQPQKPESLL